MTSRRRGHAATLAAQAIEMGVAAPQVIAERMLRIATAGGQPSARDAYEFWLMGAEKFAAGCEAWNAMVIEFHRAQWAYLFSLGPGAWLGGQGHRAASRKAMRHVEATTLAVLARGVAPVHRRVVANARRLSRKR